ncbi:MAG: hypothetical protein ACI9NC_005181, partial [Verrucomicrobiales bacterium]
WPKNMLHDARMAGLAKLRRSIRSTDERQLRAVRVGRGEIAAMRLTAARSPNLRVTKVLVC